MIKETTQRTSQEKNDQVTSMLKVLEMAFDTLSGQTRESLEYNKIGISTKMAQSIENAIDKGPLESILDFGSKVSFDVKNSLNHLVNLHLSSYKENITVVKVEKRNPLHFHISLKSDTRVNRSEVNSFFDQYYISSYSEQFPILFTYGSAQKIEEISGLEEVRFA